MTIYTLTTCTDDFSLQTTLHPSEEAAIACLLANFDAEDKADPNDPIQWILNNRPSVLIDIHAHAGHLSPLTTDPATKPDDTTWTFFGHWDTDGELYIDHAVEGKAQDLYPASEAADLWSDYGTGPTLEAAEANARSNLPENDL